MKKLLLMAAFAIGCISASAQKTLTLSTYKGTDLAKYDGQTMNVSVSRYLFTGWNTISLPFSMTEEQVNEVFGSDCKLEKLVGVENDGIDVKLNFQDCKSEGIKPNTPYILYYTGENGSKQFTAENVVIMNGIASVAFTAEGTGEIVTMAAAQQQTEPQGLYGILAKDNNEVINKLYITSGEPTNKYVYSQYSDFDNVAIDFNCDVIGFMNSERAKMKGEGEEHIVLTMSQEDSGLPLLMRYMPLKEFFISMGYAIEFERNEYVMSPVLFHNIYKGALGEAAGRFILRNERGIELSEITDPQKFEFFDFELAPDVYVDFKNWKYTYIQDKEKTRAEILNKLDAIGGKRAYIINMTDTHNSKPCISHDGRIIEIPRLIDNNGHVDAKMLDLIKEEE